MIIDTLLYLGKLVEFVLPKKLLYIALDGVAPRAKMNQQRARRFRAAKDSQISTEVDEKLKEEISRIFSEANIENIQLAAKKHSWDHNAITPGTRFMDILTKCIRVFVAHKIATDGVWEKVRAPSSL